MDSIVLYLIIGLVAGIVTVLIVGALMRRSRANRGVNAAPSAKPIGRASGDDDTGAPATTVAVLEPELTAVAPPVTDELVAEPIEDLEGLLEVEIPEPALGRMQRLRARLARSQNTLGKGLLSLLSRDSIDEATWDEIEEVLLTADLGVASTTQLMDRLRTRVQVEGASDPVRVRSMLQEELVALVDPSMDRTVHSQRVGDRPGVILVVGVNGTGKTTTTGKLARLAVAQDRTVVLGAADTFRAAAADQLQTWAERVGAAVVRGPEGGDPAAVAFDAVSIGQDAGVDTVIIDTAGRLHTKTGLMDELGKVKRVVEKKSPVDEVLLVLDATTGQNGLVQARVFSEVVDITGIVLTKLDGTARGGIVVAVQRELGVPVKLVGLGEGPDDLAPFEPEVFVSALLGD